MNSDNIWDILGISPTNDISIIKKAYAQKLKIHRPESDAQGYQTLREAYDLALKYQKMSFYADIESNDDGNEEENEAYHDSSPADIEVKDIFKDIDEFIGKVDTLYSDIRKRIDKSEWISLLNSDIIWDIQPRNMVSVRLLYYLKEHMYIPQEILVLLNNEFKWTEHKLQFYDDTEHFLKYLSFLVNSNRNFNYGFKGIENYDYDEYFMHRDNAFAILHTFQHGAFELELSLAKKIYKDDPDLYRMEFEHYNKKILGDFDNYKINALNEIIRLEPNDIEALCQRAKLSFKEGRFDDAVEDCLHIIEFSPDNLSAISLLLDCYKYIKNPEQKTALKQTIKNSKSIIKEIKKAKAKSMMENFSIMTLLYKILRISCYTLAVLFYLSILIVIIYYVVLYFT